VCEPDVQHGGLNEVDLAVNPLDVGNVALAYIAEEPPFFSVELRLSQDAGATWPFLTEGTTPVSYVAPLIGGDPVTAFDSQGRLFWCYLVLHENPGPAYGFCPCTIEYSCWGEHSACQNVVIAEVDPQDGSVLQTFPITATFVADKPWLAADPNPSSPFRDRLYAVWNAPSNRLLKDARSGGCHAAAIPPRGFIAALPLRGNSWQCGAGIPHRRPERRDR
jgi:hypothetical protein